MQHEIYIQESLARMERVRRQQRLARALALDETPQASLPRRAACLAGRALVSLGTRLLSFGGERVGSGDRLARYTAQQSYSRN